MATKLNYKPIIEDIKNSKDEEYELTQKKSKRLINQDLPKSLFDKKYIEKGKNELARFIRDEKYDFEVIPARIIIRKKKKL